jgi:hypothetical protein
MAIRVTCRGCHTRFQVSDKFAGREGPCPKCKAVIRIPDKSQEVVIHAPPEAGPKDRSGVALTKPIFRREVVITPLWWTVILGVIATFFVLAVVIRGQIADKVNFPSWILIVGAVAVSIPAVYAAYGLLRDIELGAFLGRELWIRVVICAALYAALWILMPTAAYAFNGYDTITWTVAISVMIGLGGAVAMSVLDFEYLVGVMHYGMYLGCTLLLRWIMGVGIFPGRVRSAASADAQSIWTAVGEAIGRLI